MSLVGTKVHNFQIVERIGAGGMGEVYLAIDTVLERKVAVKAVRADRRMDARTKARFLREARTLSQIDHPNICRVFEFIEEAGLDLIVLELVDGNPLSKLVRGDPPHQQRVAIAEQVGQALVAAHSLSVVHRDLKPENVMVAADGTVKVLDFGLAHIEATEVDESDSTVHRFEVSAKSTHRDTDSLTMLGDVLGTPRYMSPEQSRGEPATAASDMYSFGLLLQKLFSSTPPYPDGLPHDLLMNRIMWGDTEPVTGCAAHLKALINRLTSFSPPERPTAAETAERLAWIRKTPRRRARRAFFSGVMIALAIAAAVSTWGFLSARRSAQEARQAQEDAESVSAFLRAMLKSPGPAREGFEVKVIDVLDNAVTVANEDFSDQPRRRSTLLHVLGETYQTLGEYDRASELLMTARELREKVYGAEHPETLRSDLSLVEAWIRQGSYEQAESRARAVLEIAEPGLGPNHLVTIEAKYVLEWTLESLGRFDEAEPLLREVVAGRIAALGAEHEETLGARQTLGNVLRSLGRYGESETELRDVLVVKRRALGDHHVNTANAMINLAAVLFRLRRFEETEALLREALAIQERRMGPDHAELADSTTNLAVALTQLDRHEEAGRLFRRAYTIAETSFGRDHPTTLVMLRNLGVSKRKTGRLDEAEELIRRALDSQERLLGEHHTDTLQTVYHLANVLSASGQSSAAIATYRRALSGFREARGEDHPSTLDAAGSLGEELLDAGRAEEAIAVLRDGFTRYRTARPDDVVQALEFGQLLATALEATGRPEEALSMLRECLDLGTAADGELEEETAEIARRLEELLRTAGRDAEAAEIEAAYPTPD